MPHRSYASTANYRFGFNGKENDNEPKGLGNQQDYGMRIYDPRLGSWFAMDNVFKADLSPYQFAGNNPINMVDPDGDDEIHFFVITRVYHSGKSLTIKVPELVAVQITTRPGNDQFFYHNTIEDYSKEDGHIGKSIQYYKEFLPFDDGKNSLTYSLSDNAFGVKPDSDRETFRKLMHNCPAVAMYLAQHNPDKYGTMFQELYLDHLYKDVIPSIEMGAALVMLMAFSIDEYAARNELKNGGQSLFNIRGNNKVGFAVEGTTGANLPPGFPTIDKWTDQTIQSTKSLDLGAKSYQTKEGVFGKLKRYIDDLAGFSGATRTFRKGPMTGVTVTITPDDYSTRVFDLHLPSNSKPTRAQRSALKMAKKYAKENGIKMKITYD